MGEANKLKAYENSPIHLSEDNGDAIEVILRVLHHDTCGFIVPTELEIMASVALHCDKYDCYSILRPWVAQWLLPIRQVEKSATSLGMQLCIAFNLRDSDHFSKSSLRHRQILVPALHPNGKITAYSTFYWIRS
jgi:hypothetical protein